MKKTKIIILIFLASVLKLTAQEYNQDSTVRELRKKGVRENMILEIVNYEKYLHDQKINTEPHHHESAIEENSGQLPEREKITLNSADLRPEASYIAEGCDNLDFEQGSFANWTAQYGIYKYPEGDSIAGTGVLTNRHTLHYVGSGNDPVIGIPKVRPGSLYSVQLGNYEVGAQTESLSRTFLVTEDNQNFVYHYAFILQNPEDHDPGERPRFRVTMEHYNAETWEEIECAALDIRAASSVPGTSMITFISTIQTIGYVVYKDWSSRAVDLTSYLGDMVRITFQTYDCTRKGHSGYAYIDGSCLPDNINYADKHPCSQHFEFSSDLIGHVFDETISWDFGDEGTSDEATPSHDYASSGTYTVTLTISYPNPQNLETNCTFTTSREITITECEPIVCEECIPSFSPKAGKYVVSAWIKEKDASIDLKTYTDSYLGISFVSDPTTYTLYPTGQIIDGWQRIEATIEIPVPATDLNMEFNTAAEEAYFDDIRFFPLDASMMSYVYDPINLRLMAELDDRNYATLYEYDEEGKLIRTKKETERGVMTIQENRNNMSKKP